MKNICIVGCGWVGTALAANLQKRYTTICIDKEYKLQKKELANCSCIVISIPAKNINQQTLEELFKYINKDAQIIYYSSISFYKQKEPIVNAEELIKKYSSNAVILRLGGLMGYDRIAGKQTAKKTIKDAISNYIHQDDVVAITKFIIEQNINNKTLDLVAPKQALKSTIFANNAKKFGFALTNFVGYEDSKKLSLNLSYNFIKEDVLEFWK